MIDLLVQYLTVGKYCSRIDSSFNSVHRRLEVLIR